jgi:hypothetical protein
MNDLELMLGGTVSAEMRQLRADPASKFERENAPRTHFLREGFGAISRASVKYLFDVLRFIGENRCYDPVVRALFMDLPADVRVETDEKSFAKVLIVFQWATTRGGEGTQDAVTRLDSPRFELNLSESQSDTNVSARLRNAGPGNTFRTSRASAAFQNCGHER